MPNQPGVRVLFQDSPDTTVNIVNAELPTLIVGPLYQVFERDQSSTNFDPVGVDQDFVWPSLKIGSVVDLQGTRNGLIDSQRKDLATLVPSVELVDGSIRYTVSDDNISNLSQSGFRVAIEARNGLDRGTLDVYILDLDGEEVLYNPQGGLTLAQVGDFLDIASSKFTVSEVSDTTLKVDESLSSNLSTLVAYQEDEGSSVALSVTPSAISGRVIVSILNSDFSTVSPGDAVVLQVPMSGLTSLTGTVGTAAAGETEVTGLTFGVTVSDLTGYVVKVVNTTTGQTTFADITAVDSVAGTLSFDTDAGMTAADSVTVTVLKAQVGYVESVATDNLSISVITSQTFSDSKSIVYIAGSTTATDVYPDFGLEVTYRALRADLADVPNTSQQVSELLTYIDHPSTDFRDELAFAVERAILAQPNERGVIYVPVDVEPDGSTGLAENLDLLAGYTNALEAAEATTGYNVVLLDKSVALDNLLETHVQTMSSDPELQYRRGFFYQEIPLGDVESETGAINPGKTVDGLAPTGAEGNKVIRDANVNFVTGASVVAGTKVVVTFPEEFAGEYTALGTTTDNDLILSGGVWPLLKEFTATSGDLNTGVDGFHVLNDASSLSIAPGLFTHVEANDYVELTVDNNGGGAANTTYRFKVISVNAAGDELVLEDEVAGVVDFGSGNPSGNVSAISVIRSWESPAVKYYIRPLSKSQQVTKLENVKTLSDERYTLILEYSPRIQVGTDDSGQPIKENLSPSLTNVAIAAKRSGLRSFDEITNLTLGGGIETATFAYGYFKKSHLRRLSDAGYTLIEQKSSTSQPFVRDMITTDTTSGIVKQEELVIANADWVARTLDEIFANPPGSQLDIITPRLLGARTIQLDSILTSWEQEGRINDSEILSVTQNELNPRQIDISLRICFPVAEKEIEIIIDRQVC